jgi:hypothetical protein
MGVDGVGPAHDAPAPIAREHSASKFIPGQERVRGHGVIYAARPLSSIH